VTIRRRSHVVTRQAMSLRRATRTATR
jgi:hypothetical protein